MNTQQKAEEYIGNIPKEWVIDTTQIIRLYNCFVDAYNQGYHEALDIKPKVARKDINKILQSVCDFTGVEVKDMRQRSRKGDIVNARHLAMYFMEKYTGMTQVEIGSYFSLGHSNVSLAIKKINNRAEVDTQYRMFVDSINVNIGKK